MPERVQIHLPAREPEGVVQRRQGKRGEKTRRANLAHRVDHIPPSHEQREREIGKRGNDSRHDDVLDELIEAEVGG